ncbi:hypothetical protein [Lelliottia nimipressuralis]|uniref:hypothetical protein n=1 Tax=Lelliottia nimipressuralis TaxID=69220 RepID=UPI002898FD40|nr:hypothetical protein [Lelliottia nimipressuralis]
MDIKMIDSSIIAIANEIFGECKVIPPYVAACECKKKRELRGKLYRLAELAYVVGCSDSCQFMLVNEIKSWLDSGKAPDSLNHCIEKIYPKENYDNKYYYLDGSEVVNVTEDDNGKDIRDQHGNLGTLSTVRTFRRRYFNKPEGMSFVLLVNLDNGPSAKERTADGCLLFRK